MIIIVTETTTETGSIGILLNQFIAYKNHIN